MPGQGKYTVYAPESNQKNILLGRLFPASPTSAFVGQEKEYRASVVATGNQYLASPSVAGDPYFGPSVNRDYALAPDTLEGAEGAWKNPGDPANSFAPDQSSPGPGKTEGVDKNSDPNIGASDIKPSYVPGGPGTGTRSPAEHAKKIAALVLGSSVKMGTSDSSTS
jgi:hypothetical protein